MRLAIVGSRDCPPIDIASHLPFVPTAIISGGAVGADTYAREYAIKNKIPLVEYLPEYGRYGRRAPIMRDIKIVENCDFLLAFWNGISRGTKFTINYAKRKGVPYRIIQVSDNSNQ